MPELTNLSFQLRHRLPLQNLGTNTNLASVNPSSKDHLRIGNGKENIHSGFKLPQSNDNNGHIFGTGAAFNTNPLCFQPGDVNFNPFIGSIPGGYRSDVTMSHNGFRPINGHQQAILSQYLSPHGTRETFVGQPEDESFYEASV